MPLGFVPAEDKGIIFTEVWLPDSASQERVLAALKKVETQLMDVDGIQAITALAGYSLIDGNGVNYATIFSTLEPWSVRVPKDRDLETIRREIQQRCASIGDGLVVSYGMPAIEGLGTGTGFDLRLQDRGSVGRAVLGQAVADVMAAARTEPAIEDVNIAFRPGVPQLFADVDREEVKRLDVPLQSVFTTLGASLGPAYINDFNLFDRTWRVYVQAEGQFRSRIEDITRLQVRNNQGQMLPLGSLLEVRSDFGPDKVYRYNLYPAALMSGNPAPGRSSGEALTAMDSLLARTLPPGVGFEWTAMAYQQKAVSGQGGIVFILALVVVYLILAALYENWLTPLAVILSIPLVVLGAMLGLTLRGMDNNICTQVGLVLLVGLGAKNAILIVEFARANRIAGMGLIESAVEASRVRLRPILMTAFAFILGVLPLVIATGAGAASRQAIGTAVFFGMIGNTSLGLVFTPVLFVAVTAVAERIFGRQKPDEPLVIDTTAPLPPLATPAH